MTKFDSINVIPFVDIMLVLLAIVLTTATFVSNSQLDITLPVADTEASEAPVDSIEIAIDRENNRYVDGRATDAQALKVQLSMLSADTRVVLRIDESVEFLQFVSLIDVLKTHSLDNVSIETRMTP